MSVFRFPTVEVDTEVDKMTDKAVIVLLYPLIKINFYSLTIQFIVNPKANQCDFWQHVCLF